MKIEFRNYIRWHGFFSSAKLKICKWSFQPKTLLRPLKIFLMNERNWIFFPLLQYKKCIVGTNRIFQSITFGQKCIWYFFQIFFFCIQYYNKVHSQRLPCVLQNLIGKQKSDYKIQSIFHYFLYPVNHF